MIYVKTLKKLIAQLPDDAKLHAYEGEDVGITIGHDATNRYWWIRAREGDAEDTYTSGFTTNWDSFPNAWEIWVKGNVLEVSLEISVIRKNNRHGHNSYGWFDDNKLLIFSSGGPCRYSLAPGIGDKMIELAFSIAEELNIKEFGGLADRLNEDPTDSIVSESIAKNPHNEAQDDSGLETDTICPICDMAVGVVDGESGTTFTHLKSQEQNMYEIEWDCPYCYTAKITQQRCIF